MSEIANPYIAGSPVTRPEMFYGREDVFANIRQALTGQHRDHVLVLYGQRRTGKTSVLYQMNRRLGERYLCIFIDLHGLALNGLGGFLWELANHIIRTLRRDYQITLPPLQQPEFMADPRSTFENVFLENVWTAIGDHHLLLMLDEAVRLQEQVQAGKLERDVFEYLRHLMQHYERLNFLFSLGSGLEEMEKEYAFLFNVALYIKISFLERQAAVALITQPIKDHCQFEPRAVERILEISSGHPYYTQLLCHSLFNRCVRGSSSTIAVEDVDGVLDEAVERGLAVLKHVWEESTPSEKAVLAAMAEAMAEQAAPVQAGEIRRILTRYNLPVPEGEMVNAIKTLISREAITGRDRYTFTIDLLRLWVQKYRRLEWVKEEIEAKVSQWASREEKRQHELKRFWEMLDPGEKIFLASLAAAIQDHDESADQDTIRRIWKKAGIPFPKDKAYPAIKSLTARNIILQDGMESERYSFVQETQRVWVQANRPLELVKEELRPALREWAGREKRSGFILIAVSILALLLITSYSALLALRDTPEEPPRPGVPSGEATQVNDLLFFKDAVWAATEGGLVRWDAGGSASVFEGAEFGFEDDCISAVVAAPDETLWMGCGGAAQARIRGEDPVFLGFYDRDDGLGMGVVRALLVDVDGSIWAGGSEGNPDRPPPLSHFDGDGWRTDEPLVASLASLGIPIEVESILRSRDEALWLGLNDGGILRWDGNGWMQFGQDQIAGSRNGSDLRIRQLLEDENGTLWAAGSNRGLLRFDPDQGLWHAVKVVDEGVNIRSIAQFADGSLWAGGDAFVARSDDGGNTWSQVGSGEGLGDDIGALVQEPSGRVWAGAYTGGVSVLEGDTWRALQP